MQDKNKFYYESTLEKNGGKEIILCAAMWFKDADLKIDIPDNRNPYNIDEGAVILGHRHPHAMWTYLAITGVNGMKDAGRYVSGFLTNCNRFVDRIEGMKLAFFASQLKFGARPKSPDGEWTELYSEDLY